MKQHTSEFKQTISKIGRQFDDYITYGNTTLRAELNEVSMHYEGALLKSIMKQLDIVSATPIPLGTQVNYKKGLKVGNSFEYLDYGNFYVYKVEKSEDKEEYNITCYDALLFSMVDYDGMQLTFPISVRSYLSALCSKIGVPFLSSGVNFANYDKMLQVDPYVDADGNGTGFTIRDILDELSQVTASNICIGKSNGTEGIEVRYITNTNDTIDENYLKNVNVTFGEKYGAINTIVLSRGAGADNIYYPAILPENPVEIKIEGNQIMNFNDRDTYMPDIYNKLNGLEYYVNDFSSTGICYYEPCDMYGVTVGETTYQCVMFNDEINTTTGTEEIIHTEIPEQAQTDYTQASKTDRVLNQTNLIVNKHTQEITALVNKTDEYDETITQLQIDVDGIESQVSGLYDLVRSASGNKAVTLDPCMEGYILEMHIYGNNSVFEQLYPATDLYPADDLYPYGDSLIEVEDEEHNITTYNLGITEVLRANEDARDEYILKDNNAQIIRRINADGTTKETEAIEDLGEMQIDVAEGTNIVRIKEYTAPISIKFIYKNNYTNQFTTQIQTQSKIEQASNQIMLEVSETYETQGDANENYSRLTQTAQEISTEVSKKVGNNEVISKINQSAEAVTINANKISLAGSNINMTTQNITLTSDTLNIDKNGKTKLNGRYGSSSVPFEIYSTTHQAVADLYANRIVIKDDIANGTMKMSMGDVQKGSGGVPLMEIGVETGYGYALLTGDTTQSPYLIIGQIGDSSSSLTKNALHTTTCWADAYNYNSLESLKKNIKKFDGNALELIKNSELYTFNYKTEKDGTKKHIGFIIGDKYKTPEIIMSDDGNGINSYTTISVMWKAIQEQQQQIEELKNEINKLKGEQYE